MSQKTEKYPPGHTFSNRYEIKAYIGGGAMGAVYEALDRKVERRVAIKCLSPDLVDDEGVRKRFEREAKAAGRIGHDNVCAVSDWGIDDDDVPYLVMELLEGESLVDRLRREKTLSIDDAITIMLQVLAALEAAHIQNIVHRDLKPENIFLARISPEQERVKLVDFGIAKFIDATGTATAFGTVMGTLFYMSPEQVGGDPEKIDHRTDIWAAGVVLYSALTGKMIFRRSTMSETMLAIVNYHPPLLSSVDEAIPQTLSDVVARAISKEREDRYQSASDFAQALRDALSESQFEGDDSSPSTEESDSEGLSVHGELPRTQILAEAPSLPEKSTSAPPSAPTVVDDELSSPPLVPTVVSQAMPGFTTASSDIDATVPPVTTEPRSGSGSRKWVAIAVIGILAATGVGVALRSQDDEGEGREEPRAAASEEPVNGSDEEVVGMTDAVERAREPASVAPELVSDSSPVEEPPLRSVTVRLVNLPRRAAVEFEGQRITDGAVSGDLGSTGTLTVEAPGYHTLSLEITLEESTDFDLGPRLTRRRNVKRVPSSGRPARPTVPAVVTDYGAE